MPGIRGSIHGRDARYPNKLFMVFLSRFRKWPRLDLDEATNNIELVVWLFSEISKLVTSLEVRYFFVCMFRSVGLQVNARTGPKRGCPVQDNNLALLNLLATDFFFKILAHPVFKM